MSDWQLRCIVCREWFGSDRIVKDACCGKTLCQGEYQRVLAIKRLERTAHIRKRRQSGIGDYFPVTNYCAICRTPKGRDGLCRNLDCMKKAAVAAERRSRWKAVQQKLEQRTLR